MYEHRRISRHKSYVAGRHTSSYTKLNTISNKRVKIGACGRAIYARNNLGMQNMLATYLP